MIDTMQKLTDFLDRYHRIGEEGCLPEDSVPSFLPPALRTIHLKYGKSFLSWGPLGAQNHLVPADKIQEWRGAYCFLMENQGCWACYFRPEDVCVYVDRTMHIEELRLEVVHESMDMFLISHCLEEAAMSSPYLFAIDDFVSPIESIPGNWELLHDHARFVCPESMIFHFDKNRSIIAMQSSLDDLWLGSYSQDLQDVIPDDADAMQISPRSNGPLLIVGNNRVLR